MVNDIGYVRRNDAIESTQRDTQQHPISIYKYMMIYHRIVRRKRAPIGLIKSI